MSEAIIIFSRRVGKPSLSLHLLGCATASIFFRTPRQMWKKITGDRVEIISRDT